MKILFVCVHNAGRSQMAEAILRDAANRIGFPVVAASAGTQSSGHLNPVAMEALTEIDVPIQGLHPKVLDEKMVAEADLIVSMGCGVDAEACPAKFLVTEDWGLDDPAGQPIETVRRIRDQISGKVNDLLGRIARQVQ